MHGLHCIRSWSSTQSVVALSVGEAEYYGIVKGASIALGMQSMGREIGMNVEIEIKTDSSTGKGIASRQGLGKTRHIEVSVLWVQQKVKEKTIKITKIPGRSNLADLMTKHLGKDDMERIMEKLSFAFETGRRKLAPELDGKLYSHMPKALPARMGEVLADKPQWR